MSTVSYRSSLYFRQLVTLPSAGGSFRLRRGYSHSQHLSACRKKLRLHETTLFASFRYGSGYREFIAAELFLAIKCGSVFEILCLSISTEPQKASRLFFRSFCRVLLGERRVSEYYSDANVESSGVNRTHCRTGVDACDGYVDKKNVWFSSPRVSRRSLLSNIAVASSNLPCGPILEGGGFERFRIGFETRVLRIRKRNLPRFPTRRRLRRL